MKENRTYQSILYLLLALGFFMNSSYGEAPVYVKTMVDAVAMSESSKKDLLVIFTADWCGICQEMKQDIEKNEILVENLIICYIDMDKNEDLVKEYGVKHIPDYFILKNKTEFGRKIGYINLEYFKRWIDKYARHNN